MTKGLHRLSIHNIVDVLARGRFIKEIQDPEDSWVRYEVIMEEANRPDLIAHRYYKTREALAIVLAAARLDNPISNSLVVGSQIPLPPPDWVRKRIRHYQGD